MSNSSESFCWLQSLLIVAFLLVMTNVGAADVSDNSTTLAMIDDHLVDEDKEETILARQSTTLCLNVLGCNCDDDQKKATCNCPNSNSVKIGLKILYLIK